MATRPGARRGAPPIAEDIETRAARLGITAERVLREYASIAFASIRNVVDWDADGRLLILPDLGLEVVAAIAEVVASAKDGRIYRVKMHDKKPVLDALARHLRLLPPAKTGAHEQEQIDEAEDPREFLIREVDRIAAEEGQGQGAAGAEC